MLIEFFSPEDLSHIANILAAHEAEMLADKEAPAATAEDKDEVPYLFPNTSPLPALATTTEEPAAAEEPEKAAEPEEDIYSVSSFTV